ncbi:MAG: SHOCT domain-containing protein [Treponema sp.]|nr:SHOCT domain-containing protein [Treponema sp.]
MKKIFCLLGLLPLLAAFTFAQESSSADELLKWKQLYDSGVISEEEYNAQKEKVMNGKITSYSDKEESNQEIFMTVDSLLDDDWEKNKEQVRKLSQQLSYSEKMKLYEEYERGAGGYFALNLLIGFGIGSFAQGNASMGLFQLGLEATGIGLMLKAEDSNSLILGSAIYLGAYIVGLINPWVYSHRHNETLREELNLNQSNFSIAPIINPMDEQYGLLAKISL